MKMEIRQFKHKAFLLLLPESRAEETVLDKFFPGALDAPKKIEGEICTDDSFNPYLRFEQ